MIFEIIRNINFEMNLLRIEKNDSWIIGKLDDPFVWLYFPPIVMSQHTHKAIRSGISIIGS